MKRRLILTLFLAALTCIALAGCSSSATGTPSSEDAADAAKAAFIGTWDIIEMSDDEGVFSREQTEAAKVLAPDTLPFINFYEDGTCTINANKVSVEFPWEAQDQSHATIGGTAKDLSLEINDGNLIMSSGAEYMKFEKIEPRDSFPRASATSSSASAQSSDTPLATVLDQETNSDTSNTSSKTESLDSASSSDDVASGSSESSTDTDPQADASSASSTQAVSDYEVSIDDIVVGSDYEGNPALIVTYTWTNNSNKTRSFASSLFPKCYQNGVQLSTAIVLDNIDSDGYIADVRPGYGTTLQMAYELKDTENPVEIEVGELASLKDEIIASKVFEF